MKQKIAFIGGGNMAEGIIRGMLKEASFLPEEIYVYDIISSRVEFLKQEYKIQGCVSIEEETKEADILVFAVRPQDAENVSVQVKSFLEDSRQLNLCRLKEKNICLELQCEPADLKKNFDKDLMLSLVNNFIDNAVKASADNSRLILEATAEKLMVQDFGKGIPAEDLDKVTEAFYMVDKSRSRANGSVGLGLALCKKIADIHGFQMKIESEIGKGTCVFIEW